MGNVKEFGEESVELYETGFELNSLVSKNYTVMNFKNHLLKRLQDCIVELGMEEYKCGNDEKAAYIGDQLMPYVVEKMNSYDDREYSFTTRSSILIDVNELDEFVGVCKEIVEFYGKPDDE